jgi:predicted GNAT family acetyltransferase
MRYRPGGGKPRGALDERSETQRRTRLRSAGRCLVTGEVEHEAERQRFVVRFAEGEGELVYRRTAAGALDLVHTGVEPRLRRRGIGESLIRAALTFARTHGLRVIPTCPFVARWLDKHPEERDLIASH